MSHSSATVTDTAGPDQPAEGSTVLRFLALGFFLFPYGVLSPAISAAVINGLALSGITFFLVRGLVPRIGGLGFFHLATVIWTVAGFLGSFPTGTIIAQANHLWQFAILTFFLVPVLRSEFDLAVELTKPSFRQLLTISTAISWAYSYASTGTIHEFAPNSLMLLLALLYGMPFGVRTVLGIAVFAAVFNLTGRFSPIMVILVLTMMRFVAVPGILAKLGALIIILSPLWIYLTLDVNELIDLKLLDHNSYIRAEFVRAAWSALQDNLAWGQGFGPSYRPHNYVYQTGHVLLRDPALLTTVSNHHSIFDTAYRFGLIVAAGFVWIVYLRPSIKGNALATGLVLVLALGMSVNAWFENQSQMPMVAFIAAYLVGLRPRSGNTQHD